MTAAGRHSPNKCPHCGASPRYGLEGHVQGCSKRPADIILAIATPPVVEWSQINDPQSWTPAIEATVELDGLKVVQCPTCGKGLKKRGAHFHIRKCKG